ncbi:uncharacterized protein LOC135390135 [Ornithodoros turicata]|uniref:uncharacterized protein LOC135390135 n=1 Tax=Ornithodoros turicata TaxID=34597 RepID=UPI003138EEA8
MQGSSDAQPPTSAPPLQSASVAHFAIRLPPFFRSRPEIWFQQAESQFALGHITSQIIKFHHVLSVLPEDVLLQIADTLSTPAALEPYDALKAAVIGRSQPSDRQRLQEIISSEALGDRKPSDLLRHMQAVLGNASFDEKLLRELFLSKLPPTVQLALSVADSTNLAALASRADKAMELYADSSFSTNLASVSSNVSSNAMHCQPSLAQSQDNSDLSPLRDEIRRLADLLDRSLSRDQPSSRRPDQRRARSRSPTPPPSRRRQLCWFHKRFGRRARRCESPCNWQGNAEGDY